MTRTREAVCRALQSGKGPAQRWALGVLFEPGDLCTWNGYEYQRNREVRRYGVYAGTKTDKGGEVHAIVSPFCRSDYGSREGLVIEERDGTVDPAKLARIDAADLVARFDATVWRSSFIREGNSHLPPRPHIVGARKAIGDALVRRFPRGLFVWCAWCRRPYGEKAAVEFATLPGWRSICLSCAAQLATEAEAATEPFNTPGRRWENGVPANVPLFMPTESLLRLREDLAAKEMAESRRHVEEARMARELREEVAVWKGEVDVWRRNHGKLASRLRALRQRSRTEREAAEATISRLREDLEAANKEAEEQRDAIGQLECSLHQAQEEARQAKGRAEMYRREAGQ